MNNLNSSNWWLIINHWLKTNKKQVLIKLACFLLAALIVIPASAILIDWAIKSPSQTYGQGFISIYITYNEGVAFSLFANSNPVVVYLIQIVTNLIIFIGVIYVKDWKISFFLSIAFFAGMTNVIDRAIPKSFAYFEDSKHIYHCVTDYFKFNFNFAVFNLPDVFVNVGIIGSIIFYLIRFFKKEPANNESDSYAS